MSLEILKDAEVRMIKDAVENIPPVVLRAREQQRLHRNAVREQEDDAQQCEVEQFNHLHVQYVLQYSVAIHIICLQTTAVTPFDLPYPKTPCRTQISRLCV